MAKKGKRLEVTKESDSGRNLEFIDKITGEKFTRPKIVERIKKGDYSDYHIRKVNGLETPVSNPDGKEGNNLGWK